MWMSIDAARRARRIAAAIVGGAAALLAADVVQAHPAEERFTYVAQDFYVVGPDLAAQAVGEKTGQQVAPLGTIRFVPSGRSVVVTIDDVGTSTGLLDVTVGQGTHEHHCVPVRHPTVIDGLTPGKLLSISIWSATFGPWTPCGIGGTAGTLTIAG